MWLRRGWRMTSQGRRIGLHFKEAGETRYYDIDSDGRVYWLRPRPNNRLQRYRVRDARLVGWILKAADSAGEPPEPAA